MSNNKQQNRQNNQQPKQGQHQQPQRPNLAHGVEIPTMAPVDTGRHQVVGEFEDEPEYEQQPQRPEPRSMPSRRRMQGRRPVKGIGQPQAMQHANLVNQAHSLLELYKKDPSQVDPTFVHLMQLEGLCAYGAKIDAVTELGDQLKQEIARLRRQVERYVAGEEEGQAERPRQSPRIERLKRRKAARGRSGLGIRGRARA